MADKKISDFSLLTGANVVIADDYIPIIDASEATPIDRNKRILINQLKIAMNLGSSVFTAGAVVFAGVSGVFSEDSNIQWDNTNKRLGVGVASPLGGIHVRKASIVSIPGILGDGAWFTGGSSTTTKPYLLIEPNGSTSTNWSVNGTGLGVNGPSGFTGNLLDIQLNGASRIEARSTGYFKVYNDIEATGDIYLGNIKTLYWNTRSAISSPANGKVLISNNAGTDFGILQFGGTTSSFPALQRSTTYIKGRLADDSAFCFIQGKLSTDTAATTGLGAGVLAALTNASIVVYDSTGQAYRIPVII